MATKSIFILFVLFNSIIELNAQSFADKKLIDSLIKSNNTKAIIVLNQWRNSVNFKNIDSFKTNFYLNYSAYYLINRNGKLANIYADSAIKISTSRNQTLKLPHAYFNKAAAYIYLDKHDSAILLHKYVIQLCDKIGNNELRAKSVNSISFNLRYLGRYKESTQWLLSQLNSIKDDESKGVANLHLAMNMIETSVFQNIDFYFQNAISHLKKSSNKKMISTAYYEFANYLRTEKRFKEALTYADSITMFYNADYSKSNFYAVKSNTFYELKDYNKALTFLDSSFVLDTKAGDEYYILCDYKEKGKILYDMGKYKESKEALSKAINLFRTQTDMIMEHEVYKYYLKSSTKLIDDNLHNDLNHFIGLKDSLFQTDMNSNLLEHTTKYKTAEKESQIKSQQLIIQKERNNRNLAIGAIGFIVLAGGGIWYYLRNKQARKELIAQNELLQLKQNFHTMEIQNLNQQLSPHEVKNMLASISPEIQEKAPESYKRLIKLLNLTMASLKSETFLDSLSNQVSQIDDLLYLEKAMLGDKLSYTIQNNIQEDIQIPRLLLKNLVENAIKHGIKTKDTGGQVKIEISKTESNYLFIVEDNGTGRTIKQTKDTGIGTSTYRKLFDILNQKNQTKASFDIIDLPQGTKIEVKIPQDYKY